MLALVFTTGQVFAQETDAEVTSEDETTIDDSEMTDGETVEDDSEITSEEIAEILNDIPELTADEIEDAGDIEGQVLLVTDEHVVITTIIGQTVKINKATYTANRPGSRRHPVEAGQTVVTGNIVTNGNETTLTTSIGNRTIDSSTKVYKDGEEISMSDISEDDEVVAIVDETGNIVSLDIVSEEGAEGGKALLWIIGAIILIILASLVLRKKQEAVVTEKE